MTITYVMILPLLRSLPSQLLQCKVLIVKGGNQNHQQNYQQLCKTLSLNHW